jgi:hypothetical protein
VCFTQVEGPITLRDQKNRSEFLIADYLRLTLGLPRHGTCEQMPEFCAAA